MAIEPEATERPAAAGEARSSFAKATASFARYRRIFSWIFAIVLLGFSARIVLDNPEPLRRLEALPAWMWAVMAPLALLNNVFVSWRMSLAVSQAGGAAVPLRAWFRIVALGQFLNSFVPQLGNVYRGVTLKREFRVSYMAYTTGLFTFVWLDTVFGFGLCLLVLGVLAPSLRLADVPVIPALLLALFAIVLAPIAASRLLGKLPLGDGLLSRVQTRASTLLETATRCLRSPRFLLRFSAVSVMVMADQVAILWLCFRAVGLPIDLPTTALFQIVVKLSNQVIITPGNLGLTELAFGALGAAAHGGSLEYGIAAALVFRMLFTVMVLVLGVLFGGIGLLRSTRRPEALAPADRDDQSAR